MTSELPATVMNDQEEAEWPEGTWLLRWVSRCVAYIVRCMFYLIVLGLAGGWFVGPKVDCWLAPNRTLPLDRCDEVPWVVLTASIYASNRLEYAQHHNLTLETAPPSCQSIKATDVAANTSECEEWCEHNLGRGAGAPILLPLFHRVVQGMVRSVDDPVDVETWNLFMMCFKAEVAVMGAYIPNKWLVGLIYRGVGLLPAIILFQKLKRMKLWRSTSEDSEDSSDDESGTAIEDTDLNPPKGEGHECSGPPCLSDCCTGCCWQPPTDFCKSRWDLANSALSVLTEPLSDVFSIVTFLKNGQPFYFLVLICGFAESSANSGHDGLQAKGAMALVKSWHRGFPTKELLRHKWHDLPENVVSTFIQLYACFTLSSSDNPKEVIMFGVFAWLSLGLTLADATLWLDESLNYDDFYEVQRAKKEVKGKKYVLPVFLVAFVQSIQSCRQARTVLHISPLGENLMRFVLLPEVLLIVGMMYWEMCATPCFGVKDIAAGMGCCFVCSVLFATVDLHVNILVAQWEWIREIWKQSTWPPKLEVPKLEVIAAMMQTVSRTAGVLAEGMVDCKLPQIYLSVYMNIYYIDTYL